MTLPSKELASAVFGMDIEDVKMSSRVDNEFICWIGTEHTRAINIYEFVHMVKELISNRYPNFSIKWANHQAIGAADFHVKVWLYNECIGKGKSEPEAIFKAGEWLLKEIEK